MRVLLLHPEDTLPAPLLKQGWDLIVDFGLAPVSSYENWSKQAGCRVISIYDFAQETEDFRRVKQLLQPAMGQIVDRLGIDWWDVLSIFLINDLLRILAIRRLAGQISLQYEFHYTRLHPLMEMLRRINAGSLHTLESRGQSWSRRAGHYAEVLTKLDPSQLLQVISDKFDPEYAVRRRLAVRRPSTGQRTILLPTGYVNVSRTAVAFAAMLPSEQFLLVCARRAGRLTSLPPNVRMTSLDPYFGHSDPVEIRALEQRWIAARNQLIAGAEEFAMAQAGGLLQGIPALLRSGVAMRNAWNEVYEAENIGACLSADDGAPNTRIPLILGKNRGIPTLACHHGALDCLMLVKQQYADFQIAKTQMEWDYLVRVCQLDPARVITGAPASVERRSSESVPASTEHPCITFFTEPYQMDGWHIAEVYRGLLPPICSLAETMGLRLVFKIHPFESVKRVQGFLQRYLPRAQASRIEVVAGIASDDLWRNTKLAFTVASSVALECKARGIPNFLCAWLRDSYTGYIKQFARFGIGYELSSPDQIADVPNILAKSAGEPQVEALTTAIDPGKLRATLLGTYAARA